MTAPLTHDEFSRMLDSYSKAGADLGCVPSQAIEDKCVELLVGAALLAFFTDLAILVRRTPAPCPWCGYDKVRCGDVAYCSACSATGPACAPLFHEVETWNRVAIPQEYRRLR